MIMLEQCLKSIRKLGRILVPCIVIMGGSLSANAGLIVDAANDFLPSFAGPQNGDLDVLSIDVTFNGVNFFLHAELNGTVGTTAGGLYVWGVNRGAGTAGFPTIAPGVLFDRVVIVNSNGTGTVSGIPLPSVTISGSEIFATVPVSNLPSTGFAPLDYTWNLWSRSPAILGNPLGAIADFAPYNSSITATAVPEPSSFALLGLGAIGIAWRACRRK